VLKAEMMANPGDDDGLAGVSPTLNGDASQNQVESREDPDRPEKYRADRWWRKGEQAEYRKLMAHIYVLRKRTRYLLAVDSGASAEIIRAARSALADRSWGCADKKDKRTAESAHEYADALEELIPLIADSTYLNTVWKYELARSKDSDDVTLTSLLNSNTPGECEDNSAMPRPANPHVSPLDTAAMAQTLRLLFQKRTDRLRHIRLMNRLRRFYFSRLAVLIVAILGLVIFTVIWHPGGKFPDDAPLWEILIAFGLGALGGTLSSTLKMRDIGELNSFRNVVTFLWMQTIFGALFGLVAWLILFSGSVTVGSSGTSWESRAVVAFLAGYSEPYVLGVLNRVMGFPR
jgi:hypothetical protein